MYLFSDIRPGHILWAFGIRIRNRDDVRWVSAFVFHGLSSSAAQSAGIRTKIRTISTLSSSQPLEPLWGWLPVVFLIDYQAIAARFQDGLIFFLEYDCTICIKKCYCEMHFRQAQPSQLSSLFQCLRITGAIGQIRLNSGFLPCTYKKKYDSVRFL